MKKDWKHGKNNIFLTFCSATPCACKSLPSTVQWERAVLKWLNLFRKNDMGTASLESTHYITTSDYCLSPGSHWLQVRNCASSAELKRFHTHMSVQSVQLRERFQRHLCGLLHRYLLKSPPKSQKVVQELLLGIGAAKSALHRFGRCHCWQ